MRSAEGKAALSFSLLAALIIGFIMLNTSGVITLASLRAQLAEEEIAMVALSEEEAEENHFLRIDGDDIEADLITIENDYLNNTLIIEVEGEDADYFTNHPLAGNSDHIYGMWCGETDKGFEFDIELDSLYEFCLTSGEGCYYVDFAEAHDVYDKVVVIDPGHGGESSPGTVRQGILESDITLDIGLLVFEMLSEQEDLGVYITRVDDVDTSLDDRVYLANTFDADAFVSIHCNSTTSGEMDGIG
ncbi:MAG: N-acetylmuramoyl-L-alanine amidase, partial [Eubacterium sp.]|nr:N-acetylmuramoyl-L-alanine amidase [Eubacterium sp.]